MNSAVAGIINVAVALVALAALAVIVGQRSKTSDVIRATGGAFTSAITAAQGPVLGDNVLNLRPGVGFP
jgi:VIT1/CCC1 family predicted Fe2+/Mn2+ transporter